MFQHMGAYKILSVTVRHKRVVSSLSRLLVANRSLASDGQTEMTASLYLPNKSCRLPIKSIHAAIITIVSHDMYEIGNNGSRLGLFGKWRADKLIRGGAKDKRGVGGGLVVARWTLSSVIIIITL